MKHDGGRDDRHGDWWREDFEERLRRDLHDDALGMRPAGDGLARIRSRTGRHGGRAPLLAALTAVAVAASTVGVTVVLRRDRDPGTVTSVAAEDPTSATSPTTAPSTTRPASPTPRPRTPTPRATVTGTATGAASVRPASCVAARAEGDRPALYRIGGAAATPRLYREYDATGSGASACSVLQRSLTGAPADPDYRTLWPVATKVERVLVDGATAEVTLSSAALARTATSAQARAAVQQLVFTTTAATRATRVRLLVGGRAVSSLWGQRLDAVQTRAPLLDVQAQVWILDPAQGARSASPVTVRVYGTGFEGNVVLAVTRAGREVARTNVTTAMGEFAEASTTLSLPAGSYVVRAYNEAETGLVEQDSKAFRVR